MRIGLALSLTSTGGGGAVFDPATLAATIWVRGSYADSPWTGVASAGSSGARNLTEATNKPSAGTAVNGFAPAVFDGSNDILANATAISTLLGSAWSCAILVKPVANSMAADAASLDMASDTGGYWGIGTWDNSGDKFVVSQFDSAYRTREVAITIGSWNLCQAVWNGTTMKARVNGGAWTATTAVAAFGDATGTIQLGKAFNANFGNNQILDWMLAATAFSDATFDNILSYARARYALAL